MAPIDNNRAALLLVASTAAFTLNDTFMKILTAELPLMETIALRGVVVTLGLGAIAFRARALWVRLSGMDAAMVGLRGFAEAVTTFFFVTALARIPLANLTAILQALPLTVTLAAAVFLGEPVGWRRLTAILVGFLGVMLIVRPGPAGFDIYALYGLASVATITLRDVATRRLSAAVPSTFVALVTAAMVTLAALAATAVAEEWVTPAPRSLLHLGAAAVTVLAGYLASLIALRWGDLGFVGPFRYTGLVWALILGLAVFGDWPDATTLAGAAIVVATGIYTLHRERARARAAAARARG
ncbi:MAG: DMT family transporter [Rhodobacteraceae bacterium]|nr:DMT family transporter [Paracoccaceae bacterium]